MNEIESFIDGLDFPIDVQQQKDFEAIKNALSSGKVTGLTLEILYEALSQMKSDPTITISEACYNALWEWDC